MPHIHTIEDNYDYRVKRILNQIKKDHAENGEEITEEWLWENLEVLGEYFYNDILDYMGFEDALDADD